MSTNGISSTVFCQGRANSKAFLVCITVCAPNSLLTRAVTDARFLELSHILSNPPPIPISSQESVPDSDAQVQPEAAVPNVPGIPSTSGGFHFMQASELEGPPLTESQEWVDVPNGEEVTQQQPMEIEPEAEPEIVTQAHVGIPDETDATEQAGLVV